MSGGQNLADFWKVSKTQNLIKSLLYAMPRYRKRRYRRAVVSAPSYTITRKLVKNLAWTRVGDSQYYVASAQICLNPSNLTSDRAGSVITIKHIQVQLLNLPSVRRLNEQQREWQTGQFGGGWICVYVPEGTNVNRPFPDWDAGKTSFSLYEPNQFVLGTGTWLEGPRISSSTQAIPAGGLRYESGGDTSAGRNMTLRVPLSRRLNPGDSIEMIYYMRSSADWTQEFSVDGCESIVTYASKQNSLVCSKLNFCPLSKCWVAPPSKPRGQSQFFK